MFRHRCVIIRPSILYRPIDIKTTYWNTCLLYTKSHLEKAEFVQIELCLETEYLRLISLHSMLKEEVGLWDHLAYVAVYLSPYERLNQLVVHKNVQERDERRGRVVNTPTSYLRGPRFDFRPRWTAILGFCGFPRSLQPNVGTVP
jgi:hypothetical protein